jgi:hypothetical protein
VRYQQVPGPAESRITLTAKQAETMHELIRSLGATLAEWGLEVESALRPHIEPRAFAERFVRLALQNANVLIAALADDLGTDPLEAPEWDELLWRLALLGGLSGEVVLPEPPVGQPPMLAL